MKRWRLLVIGVLLLTIAPWGFGGHGQAAAGPTCDWFYYQEDAQLVYEESESWGGLPALAPDGSGVTCAQLKSLADDGLLRDAAPTGAEEATVIEVVDGDTIDIEYGPNKEALTVRLVVIDTPELARNGDPADCYGDEAAAYVGDILEPGETIWLTPDARNTDRYDRLLRHVWITDDDGSVVLLERELTRRGFAITKDYGEKSIYLPYVAEGMRIANIGGLGMWGSCKDLPAPKFVFDGLNDLRDGKAAPFQLDEQTAAPIGEGAASGGAAAEPTAANDGVTQSGNCDPSYPSVCIPPAPPDLDCKDVPYKRFEVRPPDPHNFDRDGNGIGCES